MLISPCQPLAQKNWIKPDYAQLEVATAAAIEEHAKQVAEQPFGESILADESSEDVAANEAEFAADVDMSPPSETETEAEAIHSESAVD